jgi:hypothetical protein
MTKTTRLFCFAAVAGLALSACLPESAQVVMLTPETPELAELLRAADARWESAGVDPDRIQIGPGGAPVRLVPERAPVAETRTVGRGHVFAGVRWMELYSLDLDVATHELGHALHIGYPELDLMHLPEADCAGEDRPLMCAHVGKAIGAADLDLACSVGACSHFTPEL